MSKFTQFERQIDKLRAAVSQPAQENVLNDPDYPRLRALVLKACEPWEELQRALEDTFISLELAGMCTERALHDIVVQVLKPHMPARIAVAKALMELSKEVA